MREVRVLDLKSISLVVISPVRNEAENIKSTIESMIAQTFKPVRWIIVDDGSTDGTGEIVLKYSKEHDWIQLIELPDRGFYDLMQGGEIKAFYRGFDSIPDLDWDFLAKLDGDISLERTYLHKVLMRFIENPKLGIASGACFNERKGVKVIEKVYEKHVRGAGRIYRKQCWDDISGVARDLAWDAVDVYKARMLGWETASFEDIEMIHHVETGTKDGAFRGFIRQGRVAYLMGIHPFFFLAKSGYFLTRRPRLIGSIGYHYGFVKSLFKGEKRIVDPELMKFIREEQKERMKTFFRSNRKNVNH